MHRRRSCFWGLLVPILCLLSLIVIVGLVTETSQAATTIQAEICGSLAADATWVRAASPYTVTCDTTVEDGVRLEIEPGVEIRFEPGTGLVVKGTLAASGTPTQPITFTSNLPAPARGDWRGLRFEGASSASALRWCAVEYATTGVLVYAANGNTVSPSLADCVIRENAQAGVQVEGLAAGCSGASAGPSIAHCTIEGNAGPGIYYYGHGSSEGCTTIQYGVAGGTLTGTLIRYNGYGIRIRSRAGTLSKGRADPTLDANRIMGNTGAGISMDGDDPVHATIQNTLVYENGAAGIDWTAGDPGSNPYLVNNTIVANGEDGIVCSGTYAGNTLIQNNVLAANGGYGMSCLGLAEPEISTNDVWANALAGTGGCPAGEGELAADPRFVDAVTGDFRLELGSPCIDAGTGIDAPGTDFEGNTRPQGDGVDIGAHEFWSAEISVRQGSADIGEGASLAFGPVQVGSGRLVPFAVGNLGNRALTVSEIDLWPPEHFTAIVSGGLPLMVGAGLTEPFDLEFVPRVTGEHTATVSIVSDDPDENPYRFVVSGLGAQSITSLSIEGPEMGLSGHTCVFTAAVQPLTVTQPVTYVWRAAGQPPITSTAGLSNLASFAWTIPGPQVVIVTAANVLGRLAATHTIALYTAVESDFSADPTRGPAPLTVTFANTSRGDYDASWWDLGDGTITTLENPAHTYAVPGAYTVTLQVSGPGGSDTVSKGAYILVERYKVRLPLVAH